MVCKKCKLKKKLIKNKQISSHKWKYHDRKKQINTNKTCIIINASDAILETKLLCASNNKNTTSISDTDLDDTTLGKTFENCKFPNVLQVI
jgi:hypothetical protein